ncbi:Beta-glucan synthesis-associated protein [Sparassis crispa]|uniref:Beta-glucan synthesis-associated protein n=1 Tax=Sparassis crispa TaxID=139825 RepID=A0A401GRN0_9APHY|nr:Beta-glucan synthesis-associated protein [Sparassis crispa]GBE84810.1 Beta-glucan synthesis-associated protein [Sparassis crispa]
MSTQWPITDAGDDPSGSSQGSSQGSSIHEDVADFSPSRTPLTSTFESPLLPENAATSRSLPINFVSSPLNPNHAPHRQPLARQSPSFNRLASEESHALAAQLSSLDSGHRGSMILYKLDLAPPRMGQRDSIASSSGASLLSLSADSKYPSGAVVQSQRGFVPYAFDPEQELSDFPDDDDYLHVPDPKTDRVSFWSWRGIVNMSMLAILLAALLALFVCYPVVTYFRDNKYNRAIADNIAVNATGQQATRRELADEAVLALPHAQKAPLIDPDTPASVRTRVGSDGEPYELVFSDEFNADGRTFGGGDDPFWEAVEDRPFAVTTRGGSLRVAADGMLQSWNRFCFTGGYIEVAVRLPAARAGSYEAAAWTMGNLAHAGFPATMEGVWPYAYDACDARTLPDLTQPQLSRGQRLSACTCSGEDHPGPSTSKGRGAPSVDIFRTLTDRRVSQTAWLAPSPHDHVNRIPVRSREQFVSFGFEYSVDPSRPGAGFMHWQLDGQPSETLGSAAYPLDTPRRWIPEEPMSIVLSLASDLSADTEHMEMLVDYVRVYQRTGQRNVGCSPARYPTAEYIEAHIDAYTNRSMASWSQAGGRYAWPKNSMSGC